MSSHEVHFSSSEFMSNMLSIYSSLQADGNMGDVTLVCKDQNMKAHKVVLSAGSSLLHQLLSSSYLGPEPVIYFPDFLFDDIQLIMNFLYFGQIFVQEDKMEEILDIARILQVKGIKECRQESDPLTNEETIRVVKIESNEGDESYNLVDVKEEPFDYDFDQVSVDFPCISMDTNPNIEHIDPINTENNADEQRYKCDLCEFRATQNDKLKMHKELQHGGIPLCCCPKCDYPASSIELMQLHFKQYHERLPKSEFPEHLRIKDFKKDKDGKLICEQCNYKTKYHHVLKKHKLSQHSNIRYQCTECYKYFSTNDNMKRHAKSVHTDETPIPCRMCQYVGKTASHLKKHMMSKHTVVNEKYLELNTEDPSNN